MKHALIILSLALLSRPALAELPSAQKPKASIPTNTAKTPATTPANGQTATDPNFNIQDYYSAMRANTGYNGLFAGQNGQSFVAPQNRSQADLGGMIAALFTNDGTSVGNKIFRTLGTFVLSSVSMPYTGVDYFSQNAGLTNSLSGEALANKSYSSLFQHPCIISGSNGQANYWKGKNPNGDVFDVRKYRSNITQSPTANTNKEGYIDVRKYRPGN